MSLLSLLQKILMGEYVRVSVSVAHVHITLEKTSFPQRTFFFQKNIVSTFVWNLQNAVDRPALGCGRKRHRGIVLLAADPGAANHMALFYPVVLFVFITFCFLLIHDSERDRKSGVSWERGQTLTPKTMLDSCHCI